MSSSPKNSYSLLQRGSLAYAWSESSFLSKAQANYALNRLWRLVRGGESDRSPIDSALEQSEPSIVFPSVSHKTVEQLHGLQDNTLPWIELDQVLPADYSLSLDTHRLPKLCCPYPDYDPNYIPNEHFPLDLVTLTFLLLSRWEEHFWPYQPDTWNNYASPSCLAHRQNFLDRPILDEWALVLRSWIESKKDGWKAIEEKPRYFISHDIDRPFKYINNYRILRAFAGGIALHHSLTRAFRNIKEGIKSRLDWREDPFYLGWQELLKFAPKVTCQATFFLMATEPSQFDEGYVLSREPFQSILQRIREEGHQIGWHPGYRAAEDDRIFWQERERIAPFLNEDNFGVRHHYLRWRGGSSWNRLEQAGAKFDSSLGFNEVIGFRCGTSQPFPVYDLSTDQELKIIERPLILQDGAIFSFMNGTEEEKTAQTLKIANRVSQVGGELSILIHNFDLQETQSISQFYLNAMSQLEGFPQVDNEKQIFNPTTTVAS